MVKEEKIRKNKVQRMKKEAKSGVKKWIFKKKGVAGAGVEAKKRKVFWGGFLKKNLMSEAPQNPLFLPPAPRIELLIRWIFWSKFTVFSTRFRAFFMRFLSIFTPFYPVFRGFITCALSQNFGCFDLQRVLKCGEKADRKINFSRVYFTRLV